MPTWSIVSSQIWHEIWLRSWPLVTERRPTVSTEIKIIASNSIISLTGLGTQRLKFITLKDIHLKTKWKLLNSSIIEMILWNHSKVFHLVTKPFRIISFISEHSPKLKLICIGHSIITENYVTGKVFERGICNSWNIVLDSNIILRFKYNIKITSSNTITQWEWRFLQTVLKISYSLFQCLLIATSLHLTSSTVNQFCK